MENGNATGARTGRSGRPERSVSTALAVAALGLWSCAGGGGGSAAPEMHELHAAASYTGFDAAELTWSPGCRVRCELERRIAAGEWVPVDAELGAGATGGTVPVDPALPELTEIAFRIRNVAPVQRSAWVEATFLRGVRPPAILQVQGTVRLDHSAGMHVEWTRTSLVADGVRLERQVVAEGAMPDEGAWTEIPGLAASATSYDEEAPAGWSDHARVHYRVRDLAGELASLPAYGTSYPGPIPPPAGLAAAVVDGKVRLTWTNRSRLATSVLVVRATAAGNQSGEWWLPATSTSFEDPGLAPGLYRYVLVASVGAPPGPLEEFSGPVQTIAVLGTPALEAAFAVRALSLPDGSAAGRTPEDRWAVASAATEPAVFAPEGAAWTRRDLGRYATFAECGPLLDGAGGVHLVYQDEYVPGAPTYPVRHLWHDAGGWHEEVVAATTNVLDRKLWAVAGADGALHVAWAPADAAGAIAYARKEAGAWAVETVPAVTVASAWLTTPLAVGSDGRPALVLRAPAGESPRWRVHRRTTTGWVQEAIPDDPAGIVQSVAVFAPSADRLVWVYDRPVSYDHEIRVRERVAGTWSVPQVLATLGAAPLRGIGAAISADGARLAVVGPAPELPSGADSPDALVAVRDGSGVTVVAHPRYRGHEVGFTGAGKLWVLTGLEDVYASSPDVVVPYALYEER